MLTTPSRRTLSNPFATASRPDSDALATAVPHRIPGRWLLPIVLVATTTGTVLGGAPGAGAAVAATAGPAPATAGAATSQSPGRATAPTTGAASTTVLTYRATDDAYVSSARPTSRFGDNGSLIAGAVKRDRLISFVKFTVGTPPAGRRITRVELRIAREAKSWPGTVKVKAVGASGWSERTVTWKNRPAVGADVATVRPARTASELRVNLTASVRRAGTYTFAVTSPVAADTARVRSSERGGVGPRLLVTLAASPSGPVTTPAPGPTRCTVDAKLVPTCGLLWGAAAGAFSTTPRDVAMKTWEKTAGRPGTVYHTYHRGDELFPTGSEIAMARDPLTPRLLMLNWKVAWGTTWANVAAGGQDARIDRLAAHLKSTFTEKFFLVPHHEPENDVVLTAGSGMTPQDYVAMFRHTVQRLRARGVGNVVTVMSYMNYEKWNNSPWWYDLYPGDDVVDWLGIDSYINGKPGGFHNGDFAYLMNRTTDKAAFPGWYTWATTRHPGKPVMLAEWAVYDTSTPVDPASKAALFDTVLPQLKNFPAVKGLVYFDTKADQSGKDMRIDETPQSLAAFRRITADPRFNVTIR